MDLSGTALVPSLLGEKRGGNGFTLVELLVAVSVLTVVMLLVLSLAGSTATLTTQATRKISADAQCRQALDRLDSDFNRMILRDDLPFEIGKSVPPDGGEGQVNRNDAITFYAQAEGYEGDRGVAKLGYRLFRGALQRGAEGTFWEKGDGAGDGGATDALPWLPFGAATLTPIHEDDFEPVGMDVFRFELAFLMGDGSIRASTKRLLSRDAGERVRAIIVAVAALDPKARSMMDGDLAELASLLPDAVDGKEILSVWRTVLDDPDFGSADGDAGVPAVVKAGIRVQQRYFFIGP